MALYELFSIPSHRFVSDAGTTARRQAGGLVPSSFSGQDHGHEMPVPSLLCTSKTPLHVSKKEHPHAVEEKDENAMSMRLEGKSLSRSSQRMAGSAINIKENVDCSSLQPDDLCGLKGPTGKISGDEHDFSVPICLQSDATLRPDNVRHLTSIETSHVQLESPQKRGCIASNSQGQITHPRGSNSSMSQQHENSGESKAEASVAHCQKKEDFISQHETREKATDPSIMHKSNELIGSEGGTARRFHESNDSFVEAKCLTDAEVMVNQAISGSRSCSKMSLDKKIGEHAVVEHCDTTGQKVAVRGHTKRVILPDDTDKIGPSADAIRCEALEDADRSIDISDTSILDSLPGIDICPDDIVGLIGSRHFWKARRALVNQQRVFAVQVFELHRLIKVQKLIAASPNLLLEDTILHSSPKAAVKDQPVSVSISARPHKQIKQKDDFHKRNTGECTPERSESADFLVSLQIQVVDQTESHKSICNGDLETHNTGDHLPLPHGRGKASRLPRNGAGAPSNHAASDNRSGAWCVHRPGSQWLIPVMSPSEGLIYKPYAGQCPPIAAFMAPVCVSVPAAHQQPHMGFSPCIPAPYVLPATNPLVSEPSADQVRPRLGGQPEQHSLSSCNMSNAKRGAAVPEYPREVQAAAVDGIQGGTASNASRGPPLPLPPAEPAECSRRPPSRSADPQMARVIRVVPHNRRSATESAARIFRSIQRERQQHDSV